MTLALPAFSYPADVPGAPMQCVNNADRPKCAVTACYAAAVRGEKIGGTGRYLTKDQRVATLEAVFERWAIPLERAELWAAALCNRKIAETAPDDLGYPVGSKVPSLYQVRAAERLSVAGGILALDVGLGKTITALVAARWAADQGFTSRLWIVCPLSAMFDAWEPYREWAKAIWDEVKIVSMDSCHKLVGANKRAGGVVVFDEAHSTGRMSARRTQAAHEVRAGFDFGLCLTGTLLHGGVEKALTVMDLAVPGAAAFATKWRAGEYFGCLEKNRFVVVSLAEPTGAKAKLFHDHLARFTVSMAKEDTEVRTELTIPEQTLHTITLGSGEESVEDCIVRVALEEMKKNGGELLEAAEIMHKCLREGAEQKLAWLLDEMNDPSMGVAVFAMYRDTLDLAEETLKAHGIPYVRVDGSVTGEDRAAACAKFQASEVQVFLGQIDASGVAVNLYRAFISVTLDLTLKATNYAQMLGRTCRRGQTYECHHFDVIVNSMQALCLHRLRAAENFHKDFTEYARKLKERTLTPPKGENGENHG